MSHGINKVTADRNQRALLELVQKPGNDVCADCKARAPRWGSHNLGIFICMNCASVHRKMGTHISKVKSINMDTWTKEQVEIMRQKGNLDSNAYYNPDEVRNPPPTNMIEQERDSELEKYIRGKYEFKRFIARSTVETSRPEPTQALSNQLPPAPQTKTAPARFMSVAPQSLHPPRGDSLGYRPSTSSGGKPTVSKPSQTQPNRSVSQPLPSQPPTHAPPPPPKPSNPVWDDLISLQGPSASSSLPLQFQPNSQPSAPSQPMLISNANPIGLQMTNPATFSQPSGGLGMGSTHTGVGMDPSIGIGGTNPFQQQQSNFTTTAFLPASGPSPGPNPFPQSYLSPGMTAAANPFAGMSGQSMPQSSPFHSQIQPFSQTAAAQQFQASLQSQSQSQSYFQPQPQPAQQQAPQQPFGQQPSPFATQQPSPYGQQQPSPFGQQPSPFGHQPSPQLQQPPQQQQQQMLSPGNPFGVWQQQPGGYSGQQWGGM